MAWLLVAGGFQFVAQNAQFIDEWTDRFHDAVLHALHTVLHHKHEVGILSIDIRC